MKPDLSVVYLTYNGEDIIDKTLPLVILSLNNAPINGEIIVVDNGSTDRTQNRLELFSRHHNVKIVTLPENKGFSGGNIAGYEHTEGEYIAFVSNDVYLPSYYPWDHFKSYDSDNLFAGRIIDSNGYWNLIGNKVYPYCEGWFICANRDVWDKIMWDERYYPYDCEDVDLSVQASHHNIKLTPAPNGLKHLGGYTVERNKNRLAHTKEMKKLLDAKWS